MRASTPRSCRKCWPKRLRGTCAARLLFFEPDLNVRAVAQLPQPFLVGLVRLALAQRLARDEALALRGQAAGAPLHPLHQVPAEWSLHRLADLAWLERVHDPPDFRDRVA